MTFTNSEYTQLSYLMALLAKSPASASQLSDLSRYGSDGIKSVIAHLQRQLDIYSEIKQDTLYLIANSFLSETSDEEIKTLGRILMNALNA